MSPENIEPPKSPAELYALDTATSYQYIRKLRDAGTIDDESFYGYRRSLIDILFGKGKGIFWDDAEFLQYLGYPPDITHSSLTIELEEDKPEGIVLQGDYFYNLGKKVPIENTDPYYIYFLLVYLSCISTLVYEDFLNYHFEHTNLERDTFIQLIKGTVRDHVGILFQAGQVAAISEWMKTKHKPGKVLPKTSEYNSLPEIFKDSHKLEKICEQLSRNQDEKEKEFLIIKQNPGSDLKEYYWNSDAQYLALLHKIIAPRLGEKSLRIPAPVLANLYADFFHVECTRGLEKVFQSGERNKLYTKFRTLFYFLR